MKVKIIIYGEGEYRADTLESRMVDVRVRHLKTEFERNNVSTLIVKNDDKGWLDDFVMKCPECKNLVSTDTRLDRLS